MAVDSILPHAEYGPNGYREDAPHFNSNLRTRFLLSFSVVISLAGSIGLLQIK